MSSKRLLLTIIAALCIVALYHFFAVGKFSHPEYKVSVGQVADFELIAPFDFPILKTEDQLQRERNQALAEMEKPYHLDPGVLFEAQSRIDALFDELFVAAQGGTVSDEPASRTRTFRPNPETEPLLRDLSQVERSYTALKESLSNIYNIGVYDAINRDSVMVVQGTQMRKLSLAGMLSLDQARKQFLSAISDPLSLQLATEHVNNWVNPNLSVDEDKLKELTQNTINSISIRSGEVLQNEVVIRSNTRITENELNKLNSLVEAYKEREISKSPLEQLFLALGLLMYVFAILFVINYYYSTHTSRVLHCEASLLTIDLGYLLLVALAIVNNFLLGFNNTLIPFAMIMISAATLICFDFAVMYAVFGSFLMSPFINWEIYTPVILLSSTLVTVVLIKRQKAWHEYLRVWLYLFGSIVVMNLALSLYKSDQILTVIRNLGFALVSTTLSVVGIALIVTFFEKRWNRATKQTLLELLDFNHPLLKKLATQAVGTYHHSLIVGNLSERAAEAIGANPLLARVGSYYHDIGKSQNMEIYTENNEDSSEIHSAMSPLQSAELIRNHVEEGIALANKYHLPQPVMDIIRQHHGNSKIKYFLDAAQKAGLEFEPSQFEYPGPLPQSKEAALVMLADIVESTTKAKEISSEEDIIRIIDDTIERLLREGQLDEAPITVRELNQAKKAMLPVLESIYRKRTDYPEEKPHE